MKKSIIAISAMIILSAGVATAQVEEREGVEAVQVEQVQQEEKTEIKEADLPEEVKEILNSDRFNTWDVSRVYEMTNAKKEKIYEVVLKNGEKNATFKFDAEGKTIG